MALAALKQTPAWVAYEQVRTEVRQANELYRARYIIRMSDGVELMQGDDLKDRLILYQNDLDKVRKAARSKVEALPEFTALGENAWEQLGR